MMTLSKLWVSCLALLAAVSVAEAATGPATGGARPELTAVPEARLEGAGGDTAPAPVPEAPRPGPPAKWVFQAATGTAYQFNSHLHIEQDGQEDLDFTAHYRTHPFTSGAPYYSLRLGHWTGDSAWEFETHHHLVTLVDDPTGVIENFQMTHGYNLNTLNRAWLIDGFIWRIGVGVVITHPESTVRGKTYRGDGFYEGFDLSGFCGQLSLEKRLRLWGGLFGYLEGKFTAAWASVPIEEGHATVPNYALHALIGLGFDF
jgi:hypothetical protein